MRKIVSVTASAFALLAAGCGGSENEGVLTPPTTEAGSATAATTAAGTLAEEPPAEPKADPGDFTKTNIERSVKGQYGRLWESLHPAHKQIAARSMWSRCEAEENDDAGYELTGVEILEMYDEPVQIPGQSGEVNSKAVTVKVSVSHPLLEGPVSVTETVHAVPVEGQWTWILKPGDFEAYVKGDCPVEEDEGS